MNTTHNTKTKRLRLAAVAVATPALLFAGAGTAQADPGDVSTPFDTGDVSSPFDTGDVSSPFDTGDACPPLTSCIDPPDVPSAPEFACPPLTSCIDTSRQLDPVWDIFDQPPPSTIELPDWLPQPDLHIEDDEDEWIPRVNGPVLEEDEDRVW